jgi:hypothetical protein
MFPTLGVTTPKLRNPDGPMIRVFFDVDDCINEKLKVVVRHRLGCL